MSDVILRGVRKVYDNKNVVIDNINLEIKDKEFIVLVGASGCGKSTILRMIAGLEEISGGEILIGDKKVNNIPPKDRDIAFVFQSYALYPHMTVRENIAFGLKMRKVDKATIEKKVQEAQFLIKNSSYTLAEISDILQFSSQSHFNKVFKERTGKTPTQYKNT